MSDAIECPDCGHTQTRVVDSRPDYDRASVKRRRECFRCSARWHTLELMAERVTLLEDGLARGQKPTPSSGTGPGN